MQKKNNVNTGGHIILIRCCSVHLNKFSTGESIVTVKKQFSKLLLRKLLENLSGSQENKRRQAQEFLTEYRPTLRQKKTANVNWRSIRETMTKSIAVAWMYLLVLDGLYTKQMLQRSTLCFRHRYTSPAVELRSSQSKNDTVKLSLQQHLDTEDNPNAKKIASPKLTLGQFERTQTLASESGRQR